MKPTGIETLIVRMVRILRELGPLRAGNLGFELWCRDGDVIRTENICATMHARSCGKLLKRAKQLGLVRDEQRGPNHLWYAINAPEGQNE